MAERKEKIDRQHALPISRQCSVLDICRSSAYRLPGGVNDADLEWMRKIDVLQLRHPFKGSRRLRDDLWDDDGLANQSKTRAAIDENNGDTRTLSRGYDHAA